MTENTETANPTFPRILLVEDSEHDRRIFRRLIEKEGHPYAITESHDGEAALELLKKEKFDLVVCDLNMPRMDGIELVKEAKDFLADTGVIILTGSRNPEAAAQAVRLKVMDYIFKEPQDALQTILPQQVRNAIRQVQLLRENARLTEELRLRLAHLEQIHDQMPESIFATLSEEGKVVEINPQARDLLGFGPDEKLIGRPIEEILAPLSTHLADSAREISRKGEPIQNLYVEAESPNHPERLFLFNLSRFKSESAVEGNDQPHWILTLRDVSPTKPSGEIRAVAFHGIIGRDPAILEMCELIRRVAPLPTSVLITGPTGAGKEVVARAIHAESARANKPFIAVNCTALSSEILESELFGHVRGAFTGAIAPRKGRFREADGGTLFLDEIGDTSESFQSKLLRALDSGQIEPVGQDRPVSVDVRILCATNKDLEKLVAEGKFREDLFFRINVVRIYVPPLAERPGDLPLLVEAFRREFNQKFNKAIRFVSQDAMRALAEYNWPGNVRELRHVLERAFVVAQGPTITKPDLPPVMSGQPKSGIAKAFQLATSSATLDPGEPQVGRRASLESPAKPDPISFAPPVESETDEKQRIRNALQQAGGNIGHAAQLLNVHRTTLWRKMRQYGIET